MKKSVTTGLTALALSMTHASAVFVALDDFESYTANSAVDGQNGWSASGDTNFVADPDNAGNQVLSSAETTAVTTTNVSRSIPTISTTGTGTIFFRARASATADFVIGSSDIAIPGAGSWGDFEGYMRFNLGNIDVRDEGGFANAGVYNADEWYNVWLVLDHTTDTSTLYFNQGTEDATTAAASGGFRTSGNTVHDEILSIFIRNNDAASAGFIDDIHVDNTGANLTNPAPTAAIPEPATSLLALLGLAFGMRRRR
ncbi:PEP-CTERM sorting domain-containing protein [Verrucomicrobiaceae bacterium 227]